MSPGEWLCPSTAVTAFPRMGGRFTRVPSGHALPLLPAGGGVALVMKDTQRGLLASCSASPWVWGGCALWEGKAGT